MTTQTHREDPAAFHPPSTDVSRAQVTSARDTHAHLRQEALERLLEAEEYAVLANGRRHQPSPDATRKELTALIREQADIVDGELVLLQEALEAAVDVYSEDTFLHELLDRTVETQQVLWALRVSLRDVH